MKITSQINEDFYIPKDIEKLRKARKEIITKDYSRHVPSNVIADIDRKLGCLFSLKQNIQQKRTIKLFRVSNWFNNTPNFENLIKDKNSFYIPPSNLCKRGRANLDGQPVFYGATNPLAPFEELEIEYGEIFFLSIWKIELSGLTIADYTYGKSSKQDAKLIFDKAVKNEQNKKALLKEQIDSMHFINQFFFEIFSFNKDFRHKNDRYITSSALTNRDYENRCDVIKYPSIKDSTKAINFAVTKKTADERLKLIRVLGGRFEKRNNSISFKIDIRLIGKLVSETEIGWEKYDKDLHQKKLENELDMKYISD